MINDEIFLSTLFALLILGQIAALRLRKHRVWAYSDYLWYGLSAASLLIFIKDANSSAITSQLLEIESWLDDRFASALGMFIQEGGSPDNPFIYEHLLRFRRSAAYPSGEFTDLMGRSYANVFVYLDTSPFKSFSDTPPSLDYFLSSSVLTSTNEQISKLDSLRQSKSSVRPEFLHISAYLLAIGVSIRLGKVTANI